MPSHQSADTDRDRACGLMVGIAVGNLLGIPFEGRPAGAIAGRAPDGVRDIVARYGFPDDDDLAQAIIVAEAAAERDSLDVDDFARRLWIWGETNGLGMGGLTRDALAAYGGAAPQRLARDRRSGTVREPAGLPATEASRQAWAGSRAGNGALMRCAPLAIRWRDEPDRLVRESIVSAAATHWDPRCGWSCAILCLAAAAALRGEAADPAGLLEAAQAGVAAGGEELAALGYRPEPPEAVVRTIHRAAGGAFADLSLDGADMGYTLLSLEAALVADRTSCPFEAGLRAVVEAGGDTDTNGAIAGALLGARHGLTGIPERWRSSASSIRAGRVAMETYADRLLARAAASIPASAGA